MKSSRLKKIATILTLLAMTTEKASANPIMELRGNTRETYQEWVNPELSDYLKEIYDNLPQQILESLKQKNLHIVILDNENKIEEIYKQIYDSDLSGEITGLAIPEILTCFIEGCSHSNYYYKYCKNTDILSEEQFNKLHIRAVLVHEIGHLFDRYDMYEVSSSEKFRNIFNKEQNAFKNTTMYMLDLNMADTFINNEREYFGTVLSCYVFYPDDLLKYCPLTYDYINSYLNKVEIDKKSK